MLEFDDTQHILLTRVPALTGRYEFLSFRNAAGGRAWVSAILAKVQSAAEVRASTEIGNRWVSVAFTWNGLRALAVDLGLLVTGSSDYHGSRKAPVPDERAHAKEGGGVRSARTARQTL